MVTGLLRLKLLAKNFIEYGDRQTHEMKGIAEVTVVLKNGRGFYVACSHEAQRCNDHRGVRSYCVSPSDDTFAIFSSSFIKNNGICRLLCNNR